MNLLFFFSSRRRHTRYIGDWSSDVCSSDRTRRHRDRERRAAGGRWERVAEVVDEFFDARSEERRVGKECRYWCWTVHVKTKKKGAELWETVGCIVRNVMMSILTA